MPLKKNKERKKKLTNRAHKSIKSDGQVITTNFDEERIQLFLLNVNCALKLNVAFVAAPLKTFCILLSPFLLSLYYNKCPVPSYPLLPYSVHPKACYTLLLHEVEQLAPSQQTDPLLPSSKCVIMSLPSLPPSLPPSLLNCALFRVLIQRLSNSLAVFSFKADWADPPLPTACYCVSPPYRTLPTCALECSSKSLSYSLVSPAACSFNAAKSFFVFSSSVFKGRIANIFLKT